jgi:hypothetical protein
MVLGTAPAGGSAILGILACSPDRSPREVPFSNFRVSQTLENIPIRWHFTLENMQKWKVAFAINRDQRQEGNVAQEQLILSIRHLGI